MAPYLRILCDSPPISGRVRLAAQAAAIASLIHQSAEILDLSAASPCSKQEVILGDIYLASAGQAVPRTASSELELRFSDAVMAIALRQDHTASLAPIVAACLQGEPGGYAAGTGPAPALAGAARSVITCELATAPMRALEIRDITPQLSELVKCLGLREGGLHLFPRQSGVSVFVNEHEPLLHEDMARVLEQLVPTQVAGGGNDTGWPETSGAALRTLLLGPTVRVPVIERSLWLGTWQRVLMAELAGGQPRRLVIQLCGSFDPPSAGDESGRSFERALLNEWLQDPPEVRMPFGMLLLAGGKRFRPRLAIASAKAAQGADEAGAARLGVVLEFLHTAALIHDDIVDESALRRGAPTLHLAYDDRTALRTGVYYFGRACNLLARLGLPEMTRTVMDAVFELGIGQYDEFRRRTGGPPSRAGYLRIAALKTAALTAAACAAGALLARADRATVSALRRYGHNLGLAFQIVDDVLDFAPNTGKVQRQDSGQGVLSLPIIYALETVDHDRATRLLDHARTGELGPLTDLVESSRALDRAMASALRYRDRALQALGSLPRGDWLDELKGLAATALERSH